MRNALFGTALLVSLAGATASSGAEDSGSIPYVVVVDYTADAAQFERLKSLVQDVARASIREQGCRRFDVVMPAGIPNHLTLYEVFDDQAAFAAHAASAHFKQFVAESGAINAARTATPGTMVLSLHNP